MSNDYESISLLTEGEVAERLSVSKALLRKWRRLKKGPKFVKMYGRCVRYPAHDVADSAKRPLRSDGADCMTASNFKTADYGVAGYLFARGFNLKETQRSGAQIVFCFPDTPELVAAVGDYTSNLPFPCRDLFRGLRKAKSMIQEIIHDHQTRPSRKFKPPN